MIRYAHTNLIAHDSRKLIAFYKEVLGCRSIGQTRDLRGDWLERMTGVAGAHIVGEHLCLPGYSDDHPTLEIFSYDEMCGEQNHAVNAYGFGHLAFEVDDVAAMLAQVLAAGGSQIGELIRADYPDGRQATMVYAADPEGNILELQNWRKIR